MMQTPNRWMRRMDMGIIKLYKGLQLWICKWWKQGISYIHYKWLLCRCKGNRKN